MARSSPASRAATRRTPSGHRRRAQGLRRRPLAACDRLERSRVLLKTADLIDRDREMLALIDTLESGKPIAQARGEIEGAADIWRYAAALARELRGESYARSAPTGSASCCASRSASSRSSRRGIFRC